MCRYALHPSRTSFVCIEDRHVAQFYADKTVESPRCPQCRNDMWEAGRDFKAPRKRNDSGWAAVAAVKASGKHYDSCGCGGPGWRPLTKAEVRRTSGDTRKRRRLAA